MIEPKIEIPEKFVGIKVDRKIYANAIRKSLSVTTDMKTKIFSDFKDLIQDIIDGKLCGIISISATNTSSRTEGVIRHDMKYLPGWNITKANDFPLPPIAEMEGLLQLGVLIEIIAKMHQGAFAKKPEGSFDIKQHLTELRAQMLPCDQHLSIAVVDDMPSEVADILQLLEIWPGNVTTHAVVGVPKAGAAQLAEDILAHSPNIVLLDEAIDIVKGTDVAKALLDKGFQGKLASITGGQCPEFTKSHFGSKSSISSIQSSGHSFVSFINRLISR